MDTKPTLKKAILVKQIVDLYWSESKPLGLSPVFIKHLDEAGYGLAKGDQPPECVLWEKATDRQGDLFNYLDEHTAAYLRTTIGPEHECLPTLEELKRLHRYRDLWQKRVKRREYIERLREHMGVSRERNDHDRGH